MTTVIKPTVKQRLLIVTVILIVSIGAIIGLSFINVDQKGDVYYDKLEISADLKSNGDLLVTEHWKIKFTGGAESKNAYRVFDFSDTLWEIEDISAYDNDNNTEMFFNEGFHYGSSSPIQMGDYGSYYFDTIGHKNGGELGIIYSPVTYTTTRNFTIKYTIKNAVILYSENVADLYWKVVGESFEAYINIFELTINMPSGASSSDKDNLAFFHCENEYSKYSFEGESVCYSVKRVKAGTLIEPRVVLMPKYFRLSEIADKRNTESYESIVSYEKGLVEDWNAELAGINRSFIINCVLCGVIYVLCLGVVIFINVSHGKIKGSYPRYVREIPEGWTASELGLPFYYYSGGIDGSDKLGRLISATILELARRNFLVLTPVPGDGDNAYTIEIKTDISDSQMADLRPHERTIRDMFLRVQTSIGHPFTMKEFEKYAKEHYIDVANYVGSFKSKASDKFKNGGYIGKTGTIMKAMGICGILFIVLGCLFIFAGGIIDPWGTFLFTRISLIAGGLVLLIGKPTVAKLNQKGEALHEEVHGLKRYMTDFSNLKDYDIPKLVLWEEYLVYATMMGISAEVLKELKAKYPEIAQIEQTEDFKHYYGRSYLYTYIWLSSPRFGRAVAGGVFDMGSRMCKTLSGINTSVVRLSQPRSGGSSGFGGGFGRGGGGVGGGGGGHGGGGGGFR